VRRLKTPVSEEGKKPANMAKEDVDPEVRVDRGQPAPANSVTSSFAIFGWFFPSLRNGVFKRRTLVPIPFQRVVGNPLPRTLPFLSKLSYWCVMMYACTAT